MKRQLTEAEAARIRTFPEHEQFLDAQLISMISAGIVRIRMMKHGGCYAELTDEGIEACRRHLKELGYAEPK